MIIAPFFYIFSLILLPPSKNNTNVPKVIVQPTIAPEPPVTKDTKFIYLTFDDGPLIGTSNCIDICLNQKIQATFFEVGLHQAGGPKAKALYNRILQNPDLFVITNHSYTHANGKYKDFYHHPDAAFLDFEKAQHSLNITNNIIRLPGNSAWNTTVLKKSSGLVKPVVQRLDSAGYNVMGWDVEWGFNKQGKPLESAEKLAQMIDSTFAHNHTMTKSHLVVLMHDHMFRTSVDSAKLATMIGLLKKNPNYQLRKITQYPGLKNGGR